MAGDHLGRAGRGRVLALWVLGSSYAVGHLTDGFVPHGVLDDTRYDRKPGEVIEAMVRVKLLHMTEGGYTIHDFHDYNPSAAAWRERYEKKAAAGSRGGHAAAAKRAASAVAGATSVLPSKEPDATTARVANVKPESDTDTERDPKSKIKTQDPALFARFWRAYPRKTGKGEAEKAFGRLKPDEPLLQRMVSALTWQVNQPGWTKDGGKFVPYPATWLNQKRWEDEPFEPPIVAEEPARHVSRGARNSQAWDEAAEALEAVHERRSKATNGLVEMALDRPAGHRGS